MPYVNLYTREIRCKVVYYGPGLGGKTTNLEYIHRRTEEKARGNLVSLTTAQERTLYFDFMPLSLGKIRGFDVKFQLYTVPGQVVYEQSRKLILSNVDGIVFVAAGRVRFPVQSQISGTVTDAFQSHRQQAGVRSRHESSLFPTDISSRPRRQHGSPVDGVDAGLG